MKRLLVANRGEIACRVIRAAQALNIETVAVYSEADQDALHKNTADQAHAIGPAKAQESYLNVENVLAAAAASGADSVHPGYGFLAENSAFARRVEGAGLIWVGPRPEQIDAMGDKERARAIAAQAGVPVLPGSARFAPGDNQGLEGAAEDVGYPLLVKASAGGGGIGMRQVGSPEKLREVAEATQGMAERSFGDGTIYLERYVPKARHIEIQVFGLGNGEVVHFWERECSIQRRFQKVVEEAPAPGLPGAVREAMAKAAVALASSQSYAGAGTVEFIVDADTYDFYFLEMNTRIQVEHPVTEMVTGADLVQLQLRLAGGSLTTLSQEDISLQGHAIECRIYAENPAKMFLPSPGPLAVFKLPEVSTSCRVDTGFQQGDAVTPYYDPMIAKLIVHAASRAAALQAMSDALGQTAIEGIQANEVFLNNVIEHPSFAAGDCFTGFIDQHKDALIP
ncbi:MAG: biotin carboxylase N-terminal domain-containing protein [Pseudomonadota bacterium]